MLELAIISSLLGLSLGSFVNVCAYRLPRNLSVVSMRSFCPDCQVQLRWFELLPVAGFIISRGHCKSCGKRISFIYPIIEILVAAVAVLVFLQKGISIKAVELLVFFLLMLTTVLVDWQHLVIPNQVIIAGLISGTIIKGLSNRIGLFESILASLASFLTLLIIMLLGNYFLKKQSMGMGDVKLAAVTGLFLGYQDFIIALWVSSILGAIYSLTIIKLLNRRSKIENDNSLIPFGSFLAFASGIVFFFQQQIDGIINSWLIWNL